MLSFAVACLLSVPGAILPQKASFDLIDYEAPAKWKLERKDATISYSKIDEGKGAFSLITLYQSVTSTDSSSKTFDRFWKDLIQIPLKAGAPDRLPAAEEDGWKVETGIGTFEADGKAMAAILVCATGHGRAVNVVILTNTDEFQSEIEAFLGSISYRKPVGAAPTKAATVTGPSTRFDDGWTATAGPDFVVVTNGKATVNVHYPHPEADKYDSVLANQSRRAWDVLVAPRYSNVRDFAIRDIQSWESITFVEATAEERATGKTVYLVLFRKHFSQGNGKYIEFVCDSKATFEREFMPYRNEEFGWEKLENFALRNKFAISEAELVGTWTSNSYASLRYYNINSGNFAGATATSTADEFKFLGGQKYTSDHAGASGVVGNQQFSRQVYKGSVTVEPWKMALTNRFQGETETFDCYFEMVKGGKILVLRNRLNSVWFLVKKS